MDVVKRGGERERESQAGRSRRVAGAGRAVILPLLGAWGLACDKEPCNERGKSLREGGQSQSSEAEALRSDRCVLLPGGTTAQIREEGKGSVSAVVVDESQRGRRRTVLSVDKLDSGLKVDGWWTAEAGVKCEVRGL